MGITSPVCKCKPPGPIAQTVSLPFLNQNSECGNLIWSSAGPRLSKANTPFTLRDCINQIHLYATNGITQIEMSAKKNFVRCIIIQEILKCNIIRYNKYWRGFIAC